NESEPLSNVLGNDEIRELRRKLTNFLIESEYEVVIESLEEESAYVQLNSDLSHGLEWDKQESDVVDRIFQRERLNSKDRTKDYLLATLYLPHHLIDFSPDLEYLPDKLLSIHVKRVLEDLPGYLSQEHLYNKADKIKHVLEYLAKRVNLDPYSEQTSILSSMVLDAGNLAMLLNQKNEALINPMRDRATTFQQVMSMHIEKENQPKGGSGRIGIFCSHMGTSEASVLTLSLLEGLKELDISCDFICDSASSKELQKMAEDLAERTVLLPKGIQKASALVSSLNLDIIVHTDALHDSENPAFPLAIQQLAPKQVALPSSLTTTGLDSIDHIILGKGWVDSHDQKRNDFTEDLIEVENLS
ncbi:MAG: hypothetical protein VXB01_15330, partial [Opitutae bacterium]